MPWILVIKGRNDWDGRGALTSIHPTEQAAEDALRQYVEENWDTHIGTERPEENGIDDIIDLYFEDGNERYEIVEVPEPKGNLPPQLQPLAPASDETEVYEAICYTITECEAIANHFFLAHGSAGLDYSITPLSGGRHKLRIAPAGAGKA